MPFSFSVVTTNALEPSRRSIEDRRNNPVKGRKTLFRLLQQNMLEYTFPFVPGFGPSGVNSMPFKDVVQQSLSNALAEGAHLYHADFVVSANALAKVAGDVFEEIEAGTIWNATTRWNAYMRGDPWPSTPRLHRPSIQSADRQVALLSLPRRYDWVRLLEPKARTVVADLRAELANSDLSLPTSTPDMIIVRLRDEFAQDDRFVRELPDLSRQSQQILGRAYRAFEGRVRPEDIILAIALKRSLRSDRLYQPLYEANVMQLLLEGRLGAPQVDFEVHTLQSAGTAAQETYRAASLGHVAARHAAPHRAVRELYEPPSAADLVQRILTFLNLRLDDAHIT